MVRTLTTLGIVLVLGTTSVSALPQDRAEEQYRFLAGLVDEGLFDMAAKEARSFLRDYPDHARAPLARYRLAGALWELGRRDEAEREYETLAKIDGFEYRAESLFRVGEAARERGDEKRARAALTAVLRGDQTYLHAPARLALAELDFAAQRWDAAEQGYQELLRVQPEPPEAGPARRALVWCAFERGDLEETVRRAQSFLDRESDPAAADEMRALLGEAQLGREDARAALDTFRAMKTPAHADARARGEGFALAALGEHSAAARAFETLLSGSPDSSLGPEARLQAGIEHLRAGEAEPALAHLEEAAAGNDPEVLYWLAQAQKSSGDARAALASLERALRAKPAADLAGRIQVLRGDCLTAQGRTEDARRAYESSGSEKALHAAAVNALNQGDAEEAVLLAERAVREGAGSDAQLALGEAYFAAQRWSDAERTFTALLAEPGDDAGAARVRSRLAWCRYLAGDLPAAEQRFAELCERHPSAPESEEALAMQMRIAGDTDRPDAARAVAQEYAKRYAKGRFLDQALLTLARSSSGVEQRERYQELLQRCPESALRTTAALELAESESAAGDQDRAAKRFGELLQGELAAPERARARYGLAWCQWERGQHAACAEALEPLLADGETPPEMVDAALELALWAEVRTGDTAKAIESWRALNGRQGDEKRRWDAARTVLGALREAKELDRARGLLDECVKTFQDAELRTGAQVELAYLALDAEDVERAEKVLATAARAQKGDARVAEAEYHVGEARLARGDQARALDLFTTSAAQDHPRACEALYKLGFLQLERGDLDAARTALTELVGRENCAELAPEARFLLAEVRYREGAYPEAAELFAKVRGEARDELQAKALFRLGQCQAQLERWNDCEGTLADLAARFPQFPNLAEAELVRGRALAAQKKNRPARAAFERVLALDQGDLAAAARLGVGRIHEAEGRAEEALSEYLKVALLYSHEPSVSEALFRAGSVLEQQGDADRARERYRELVAQHPRSPFAASADERLRALQETRTP